MFKQVVAQLVQYKIEILQTWKKKFFLCRRTLHWLSVWRLIYPTGLGRIFTSVVAVSVIC